MTYAAFLALCASLQARADAAAKRKDWHRAAELRARLTALKHEALRK